MEIIKKVLVGLMIAIAIIVSEVGVSYCVFQTQPKDSKNENETTLSAGEPIQVDEEQITEVVNNSPKITENIKSIVKASIEDNSSDIYLEMSDDSKCYDTEIY